MRTLALAPLLLLASGAFAQIYTTKVVVNVAGKAVQKPTFKQAAGEKATMQVQLTKAVTVTLGVQPSKAKAKVWIGYKGKEQAFTVPVGKEYAIFFLDEKQFMTDGAGRTLLGVKQKSVMNDLGGLMLKVLVSKS